MYLFALELGQNKSRYKIVFADYLQRKFVIFLVFKKTQKKPQKKAQKNPKTPKETKKLLQNKN